LLPEEVTAAMLWPSISTLTFYEGDAPVACLRERVIALVEANPWLAGRLQGELGAACVWVPDALRSYAEMCFEELSVPGLRPDQPMTAMRQAVEGRLVGRGDQCLGQDEPLFRVLVLRTEPGRFALVMSLSHVLGDGHTYYRLFGALGQQDPRPASPIGWLPFGRDSRASPILALNPRRKLEFSAAATNALGPSKLEWAGSMPAQLGNVVGSRFKIGQRWSAWEVDGSWVKAQKKGFLALDEAERRGVPWVSTNDVLTSWFLRRGGYSYGFMSVNFRGKLCGLKDVHAGNYEGGVQFWPDEFGTPAGIRRSLSSPPRYRAGRADVPGLWTSLRGNFAVATNWASVQTVCDLPGCKQLVHLPVLSKMFIDGGMIIFRPTPTTLGVVLGERKLRQGALAAEPALGARIC